MKLYHYTADADTHWNSIRASGVILPLALTGKPAAPHHQREDALLDGAVHLTDDPDCRPLDLGQQVGDALRKTEIRIEVDVDAERWAKWLNRVKFNPRYAIALDRVANHQAHRWFVHEGPILDARWVEVIDTRTEEAIWP